MTGTTVRPSITAPRFVPSLDSARLPPQMARHWPSGWTNTFYTRRDSLLERCGVLRIEPPTLDRLDHLIRSAIHQHEERFCSALLARLSTETQMQLYALLLPAESSHHPMAREPGRALLQELRADPGRASRESVREEIAKLERLRSLRLPTDLFAA